MFGKPKLVPKPDPEKQPLVHRIQVNFDTSKGALDVVASFEKKPLLHMWMLLAAMALLEPDELKAALDHILAVVAAGPTPEALAAANKNMEEIPPGTLTPAGNVSREALEAARKKANGN